MFFLSFQVYNELVFDLLDTSAHKPALQLLDDGTSMSVKGLSWHAPKTPKELLDMLAVGNTARQQSATLANKDSSRSHAVFTVSFSSYCS
jgi:hypothetical protein